MKKLSLFMLMAVGLLISTTMFAAPERPLPPTLKTPEGIEMPKPDFTKSPTRVAKKAAAGVKVAKNVNTSTEYTDLQTAITEASNDDVIQLLTELEDESYVIDKNITLDLNKYRIFDYYSEVVLTLKAENIIIKNGTISTGQTKYYNSNNVTIGNATAIQVASGHATLIDIIVSTDWASQGYSNYLPYYAVDVRENASLDINGGDFRGEYVLGLGKDNSDSQSAYSVGNVHIYGNAKFYTNHSCFVNTADNAYVVISGNTSWESNNMILNNSGKLLIEGGSFKTKGNSTISTYGTLWITGGSFIAKEGSETAISPLATEYIYGGTFSGRNNRQNSVEPSPGYKYDPVIVEGRTMYKVNPLIVQIEGGAQYSSVQEAINGATNYQKIQLEKQTVDIPYWDNGFKYNHQEGTINENVTISGKKLTIENKTTFQGSISATEGAIVSITGTENSLYDASTIFTQSGEGSKINIIGGIFGKEYTEFLADDVSFTTLPTDPVTYKAIPDAVAKIGDVKYPTLKAAIEAATENATITLLMDADDSESGDNGFCIEKALTIDLGGNTIYQKVNHGNNRGTFWFKAKGDITVKNGTLKGIDNNTNAIQYEGQGGNLNLENLTIQRSNGAAIGFMVSNGTTGDKVTTVHIGAGCQLNCACAIRINEYQTKEYFNINNAAQLGEVNIGDYNGTIVNSGTLTLTGNTTNANTLTIENTGTITINNGTFRNNITFRDEKVGIFILNGGYFTDAIKTQLDGHVTFGAGKQWNKTLVGDVEYWTVMSEDEMQCYIGENQNYKYTLLDAISKINDYETAKITLINDVNLVNTQIDINHKDITIDLNGHKISGVADNKGSLIYAYGKITIKDNSMGKTGSVIFENTSTTSSENYVIDLRNGKAYLSDITLENKSNAGVVCVAQALGGGIIELNNCKAIAPYPFRLRPSDNTNTTEIILNKSEVEGYFPIWLQMGGSNVQPNVNISIDETKITSPTNYYVIYSSSYSATSTFENVSIDIKGGEFYGTILLGGGVDENHKVIETVDLAGGIYYTHNALSPQKRSAETKIQYISGGAYYFDYETNASDKHLFSEFCEYIKPGHYATIMCLNDDATGDYIEYQGHKFTFGPCSDDGKEFWAVIDALGPSKVDIITGGTKDEPVVLDPDNYKPIDEIVIDGGVVEVKSGDIIEVNRIQVGKDGNGAGVIVETDATLIVGLNGLQVDEASTTDDKVTYVIVEAGGTLETNGTIISNDVKEIIIESDEAHGLGSVLISPDVTYNNEPRATVYMATTAHHEQSNNTYYWQHFGIPCIGAQEGKDKPDINNPVAPAWTWDTQVMSYLNQWINNKWEGFTDPQILKVPFRGYNVTNESLAGGVNYIFKGFLIGNDNAVVKFTHLGYNVMGNSYTAPIDVLTMLDNLKSTYGDNIQGTVWIYQSATDNHISATLKELQEGEAEFKTIGAMQGFILKLDNGSVDQIGNINYRDAVWMNPNKAGIPLMAPKMSNEAKANIIISSASSYDKVKLYENSDYTSAFENGADAPKLMNNALNIYANTEVGQLTSMVSDNLEGTNLSITTGKETTYTLSFEKVNNMNYILRDMITNMDIVIVEGNTYEFTAPANATLENRFKLINPAYVPTDIDEQKTSVKSQGIYTTLGQYLGTEETWTNLSQGVYVINGVKVIK